jgi:signal transduction histidine kinase
VSDVPVVRPFREGDLVKALRAGNLSETLRKLAVDALDTCLNLQAAMIDDLIDVARGRRGTLRIDLQKTDLALAVRATAEAFSPSAVAKQIDLALDVAPSPLWVDGDTIRLQQIVANLLSNAVAFTREAGRITVSLHARGEQAVLAVGDDGEGIEPARLPYVFEPFHGRDELVPPHHGGLGLGLAIVRELVTRHGGTVTADSAGKGRGSRFTVTLPRLEPSPD